MSGQDLGDLGEFGFLDLVRRWTGGSEGTALVGIGDDAAVARMGDGASMVATVDALVEGIHFRWDWSTPADVGHKAVAVNVSDLAAMGATPRWLLLALCAPLETQEELLRELIGSFAATATSYGAELIGGDTVASDRLVLAVTAIGELDSDPLLRSGAKPGELLAVTGPLGRAAAGVNLLLSQDPKGLDPEDALACMDAHRRPRARVEEGLLLRAAGVHAAIDLSDGLASDVRRLAEASGAGAEIDAARLPVAPEAGRVAEVRGWDAEQMALGGGEDFELLVALPPALGKIPGVDLIEIGRVVDEGVWVVRDGTREPLPAGGWDHFRR